MLYITTLRLKKIKTISDNISIETITETQIIDATTEEDAINKLRLFYNEKQNETIVYEFDIQSINPIII